MSALAVLPHFQIPPQIEPERHAAQEFGDADHGGFPDPTHRLEQLRVRYERVHTSAGRHRPPSVTILTPRPIEDEQLVSVRAYAQAREWRVVRTRHSGLNGLIAACLHIRGGLADGILALDFRQLKLMTDEYEALLNWLDAHWGFLAHIERAA